MIERTIRSTLTFILGIILLGSGSLTVAKEEAPTPSGFLSDYSRLTADPAEPDFQLIYKNPDYSVSDFQGLYLEDLVFFLYPEDQGKSISAKEAEKMMELANTFNQVLHEELTEQGANLVDEVGPGILHCRLAITNLGKTKSLARFHPIMRAGGVGRGSAAMEAECRDDESGEVVKQVVRADKGKRSSGVTTWSGAESVVRNWAQDLAKSVAAEKDAAQ